jgi:hypothetical protein
MLLVRYGLGGLMVIGGVVVLIISPAGLGFDGFAMAVGGGLSVVLFNVLFRLGLSSEADRDEEEQARVYFDEHSEWIPRSAPLNGGAIAVDIATWCMQMTIQSIERSRRAEASSRYAFCAPCE